MSRVMKVVPLVVLCALIIAVPSAWASWLQDGVALCTATGDQLHSQITSDGAGGAIVMWQDSRSGNNVIYAQRVYASGTLLWTTDGVPLCSAAGNQQFPQITPDGMGGAIVTWQDDRSGHSDIYAQRVNASGALQWRTDGIPLCAAGRGKERPRLTPDGAGGAIVVWVDYRRGNPGIYAQRVNGSGAIQWTKRGVALCTTAGSAPYWAELTPDGAGGAIVVWQEYRHRNKDIYRIANKDIYAQRVNASGVVQWEADGVSLRTAAGLGEPTITSDGAGGAIVTWYDSRSGNSDIYVQRVNASGSCEWMTGGVALCSAMGDQYFPQIISDGAGGAIFTWVDERIKSNCDIYAQRVSALGSLLWTTNGVALCAAMRDQANPTIVSDGAGGAVVCWMGFGNRTLDIYAQKVDASGAAQWTTNGIPLCAATGDQFNPKITSDGAGGAIVTWDDQRIRGNWDIYAQRVDAKGRCAVNGN